MPIRKDLQHFYGREWRTVIRPRILARDENRCNFCTKPNHATVYQIVSPGRAMWWIETMGFPPFNQHLITNNGDLLSTEAQLLPLSKGYRVRVVLTIAHLNHDPTDNRDKNLAALCQWCHLHHDRQHHKKTRATRKDQARPILAAVLKGEAVA